MANPPQPPISVPELRAAVDAALLPPSLARQIVMIAAVAALIVAVFDVLGADNRLAVRLLAVLAFHELGHVAAARLLGLRRAAGVWLPRGADRVQGVDAWREALVSLAGPFPGLVIALGLMAAHAHGGPISLAETAYVLALFNGLNLLPFFPLDGGRFFHALLFARHPRLEVAFRIVAAVGLAAVALTFRQTWLAVFAVFPLLGLASSFKLARAAARWRNEGPTAGLVDERMLLRLGEIFPREQKPGRLARSTITLQALLVARPTPVPMLAALFVAYALATAGAGVVVWTPAWLA